jgi:hypothetical protein
LIILLILIILIPTLSIDKSNDTKINNKEALSNLEKFKNINELNSKTYSIEAVSNEKKAKL